MPRVSIGVPVLNGERYIAQTLDSLLTQTFGDFELIISDNASTDLTEEICRSYAGRDRRIRYGRNATNLGAPANYRRVLEAASGSYFRWANCDDLFAPESLARCVQVLDNESAVVLAYPKTKLIDAQGVVMREYDDRLHLMSPRASERFVQVLDQLGLVNVLYGLIRTNALRKTRLIRRFPGGDMPLIAELALYGKFWEVPEFLFYRRFHPGAFSSYHDEAQQQEFFEPGSKGRPSFRNWKTLLAHVASVVRGPLGVHERLVLGGVLARNAISARSELATEGWVAMRQLAGRIRLDRASRS